jgi:protein-histidine pros-kinase
LCAFYRDQAHRKKADEKFRGLLESAADAMVIARQDGRIVLVNTQVEKLFGYSRGELLGQPIEMLVPEGFRDKHPSYRDSYFGGPRLRPMGGGIDFYGLRNDGTEFPVDLLAEISACLHEKRTNKRGDHLDCR